MVKSGWKWLKIVLKLQSYKGGVCKLFLGEYEYKIDNKNRFRLPSRFKKDVEGNLILTKGNDGCIFVLTNNEFDELIKKSKELPMFDSNLQKPLRLLFASASELEEDNQGRYLLPNNLKSYANIDKEVVFVGVGTRIEMWAKEKWENYSEGSNFDELSKELSDYGI